MYWLTQEENQRLQILNKEFCAVDDLTAMLITCFRKPNDDETGCEMSSLDILTTIQQKYPKLKIDRKSQSILGANLSSMGIISRHTKKGNVYTVVRIAA